ncbi:50S ribosomal protein L21e [Candidatus Micrarchaeota archaeon]|nr:50S ribosomal protein L21e [Candidatus Micrarchaeota archaeon]MBU1166058.1 50S ribosomal protein L21e [Candidatus Micrarchaeota archaeon]MBU1886879.1 50S ribosomal protein L21e [Candidatus Micrarchaeota archaeon]
MVKASGGTLSGNTRRLRGKSKVSVARAVRTFEVGNKVVIYPRSSANGRPHMRYINRHGIIIQTRGKAYIVKIKDGNKMKDLIVGSVHLKLA